MRKHLSVVAGNGKAREVVGTIYARVGMLTNRGRIQRVTPAGTIFTESGQFRKPDRLTIRHTEALKFGYPMSNGSKRLKIRTIRRGEQTIAA